MGVAAPCDGYDGAIVALAAPSGCTVEVTIGDGEGASRVHADGLGSRMEVEVPIPPGSQHLATVRLSFTASTSGTGVVALSWIGLRDGERNAVVRSTQPAYDTAWRGLILPRDRWRRGEFRCNLLFSHDELRQARAKLDTPAWREHIALLRTEADRFSARAPEDDIGEYLPTHDTRYVRPHEMGRQGYHWEALLLGFVGILDGDDDKILLALRYLMSMLHTPHWFQSAESRLPGSTWDQRCFMEEMTTTSVCLLADWFGHLLTPRAHELVRQSVWDKGLATIERDMHKWRYLHECNQGAQFCRARILGGLTLGTGWSGMERYVDNAFDDLDHILNTYIKPDGGVSEGVGYFCQTSQATLPALVAYSRATGQNADEVIARYYRRTLPYVEAMSAVAPGHCNVGGDCRIGYFCGDVVPILARIFPESAYSRILEPCLSSGSVYAVTGLPQNSGGLLGFVLGPDTVQRPESVVPEFARLADTGHLSSLRHRPGGRVRVQLVGSMANPYHSHLDRGALLLELDEVPVLIDRGMIGYGDPRCRSLRRSYMHNVVTPLVQGGAFADQLPAQQPVVPQGEGDSHSLHAHVDVTHVWRDFMQSYIRRLLSSDPAALAVVDDLTLSQAGRVAFHLHSHAPFEISGRTATLDVSGSTVHVELPWADDIQLGEAGADFSGQPVHHLIATSPVGREHRLHTTLAFARA